MECAQSVKIIQTENSKEDTEFKFNFKEEYDCAKCRTKQTNPECEACIPIKSAEGKKKCDGQENGKEFLSYGEFLLTDIARAGFVM